MTGDFARVTFDPAKHYTQVLQQQGRVTLEADWNEQGAIVLHLLRALIVDLGGDAWRAGTGFTLGFDADSALTISKGHLYVDGVLCENDGDVKFSTQPYLPLPDPDTLKPVQNKFGLVYLDAWERFVTAIDAPELREVALGGPDTTGRAQVVWQIRALDDGAMRDRLNLIDGALATRLEWAKQIKNDVLAKQLATARDTLTNLGTAIGKPDKFSVDNANTMMSSSSDCRPQMRAKGKEDDTQADLCAISPDSRFRGLENQLYRVEVHDAGLGDGKTATFKWSRENGSIVFPIVDIGAEKSSTVVTLAHLGRDESLGLCSGDWVEFIDDDIVLSRQARPLAKVTSVERGPLTVHVNITPPPAFNADKHPLLRRWDQREHVTASGVIPISESGQAKDGWLAIEDGIWVEFQPGGLYSTGDYWLIPARPELGDVEWPPSTDDASGKAWMPPAGVTHHVAALGVVQKTGIKPCIVSISPPKS